MLLTITSTLLLAGTCPPLQSPAPAHQTVGPHSIADRTGIEWTFPFAAALERAKRENRILMVKPIAFGTTRDGGW